MPGPFSTTDIGDQYALELRNRFETLQVKTENGTPNDEYENFVNAHLEAAAKFIPTKPITKYWVPWETLEVRQKRAHVKSASKSYRKKPTNTNTIKIKTAQYQLAGIYLKEQTEYIQNHVDKIRDSVEDRQSRIAWQTINEVSKRKSIAKAKLKAANQQERIKLWKQHFKIQQGNPPKLRMNQTPELLISNWTLNYDCSLKKNSIRFSEKFRIVKLQVWTRFPQKYRRPDNSTTYNSDSATQSAIKIR